VHTLITPLIVQRSFFSLWRPLTNLLHAAMWVAAAALCRPIVVVFIRSLTAKSWPARAATAAVTSALRPGFSRHRINLCNNYEKELCRKPVRFTGPAVVRKAKIPLQAYLRLLNDDTRLLKSLISVSKTSIMLMQTPSDVGLTGSGTIEKMAAMKPSKHINQHLNNRLI